MPATMHYEKTQTQTNTISVAEQVEAAMTGFYASQGGDLPENVYHMLLTEVEEPLLKATMRYTRNNQSEAARILGINRGTFRKKLAYYGML